MGKNSAIGWTTHTFNGWWGCTEVSPACDHCYARAWDARFGGDKPHWGSGVERRYFGEKHWNEPRIWDRHAKRDGIRARVFCLSMGDIFDNEVPQHWREKLWALIRETPNLDWLLLSKRSGNAPDMLPADWGDGYLNVWLGASIGNQAEAEREIPKLLAVKAALHFVSVEPKLADIDLAYSCPGHYFYDFLRGIRWHDDENGARESQLPKLDWVIVGGESDQRGFPARPFDMDSALLLVRQCMHADVPVFVKQLGSNPQWHDANGRRVKFQVKDDAGEDWTGWPEDFRVREFPRSPAAGVA